MSSRGRQRRPRDLLEILFPDENTLSVAEGRGQRISMTFLHPEGIVRAQEGGA